MSAGVKRAILASTVVVALSASFIFQPRPAAQEAAEQDEDPEVTPAELELYIDVYKAMQADHGLTIDEVLVGRGLSLEDFRGIERRVQREERLVQQVREALLDYARTLDGSSPSSAEEPADDPAKR